MGVDALQESLLRFLADAIESRSPQEILSTSKSIKGHQKPLKLSPNDKPDHLTYLSQLSQTPLKSIQKEPNQLFEEADRIQNQLSNLAFSEYTSFLRAHDSSQTIKEELPRLQASLASLDHGFSELAVKVESALKGVDKYAQERHNVGLIVQKQDIILELLEIPQVCSNRQFVCI